MPSADVNGSRLRGQRIVDALNGFNQRHPWSHNDRFHRWIVRKLPQKREAALEVGCGRGELASLLATRFALVRAIDPDAEMVRQAGTRLQGVRNSGVEQANFLSETGEYDLITMVAVLHHMDEAVALAHARQLLAPGGRLLVVGLAKQGSRLDLAWDFASVLLNPLVGLIKHPRVADLSPTAAYPVADPALALSQIRASAASLLPGSRLRRRLFFRYTLVWEKPRLSSG